jgi:signal transduction histidine kinase
VGATVPVKQSFPGVLFTAVAVGWGLYLRVRREQVASLRERARQVEAAQEHRAELVRQAERRRIAREMHDVLAHRLSLLSVHAGALEFRSDASAAEIAQAAAVIRASASAALSDLREVITVLREDTAGPPSPAFAQIPALIEESRAAGMLVEAHIEVQDAESLPAVLGRTAYRVVQEGLTNALKHAPRSTITITITYRADDLVVEVSDDGGATGPGPGGGYGLAGLRERVAIFGGCLEAGRRPVGGWTVSASFPASPPEPG